MRKAFRAREENRETEPTNERDGHVFERYLRSSETKVKNSRP